MKYEDLKNLKMMYQDVEHQLFETTHKYDTQSCVFFGLKKDVMERMAISFLENHHVYNSTNYDALIDYLLSESNCISNRLFRLLDK